MQISKNACSEIISQHLHFYNTTRDSLFSLVRGNFIQVDVFYQEISYEEIQQNKGFECLSLLSEVINQEICIDSVDKSKI